VKLAFAISSAAILAALGVSGCTVGPNYHRADAPAATHWDVAEPWRESAPKDALGKGDWWEVFRDDDLKRLRTRRFTVQPNHQNFRSSPRTGSRALAAVQISTQFPQFSTGLSPETPAPFRQSPSEQQFYCPWPRQPKTVTRFLSSPSTTSSTFSADVAAASKQLKPAINPMPRIWKMFRLLITSELAGDFFSLRQLDTQISLLSRTVDALSKGLDLVNSRYHGGVASGLDVAQEETLLDTTRTQLTLLHQQRKQFEDAIAVLVGKSAPDFHVAPRELSVQPPALNAGLPSDLLERRPDIAEAEREMAVANAQIGIAKAAYYPSFNLFANGGWQAADIAKLASIQSTFWANRRKRRRKHLHRRRTPRSSSIRTSRLRRHRRQLSRYRPASLSRSPGQPHRPGHPRSSFPVPAASRGRFPPQSRYRHQPL